MECAASAPPSSLQGCIDGVFQKKQPIATTVWRRGTMGEQLLPHFLKDRFQVVDRAREYLCDKTEQ